MSINIKANELARGIIESDEFKEFKQSKLSIERNRSYQSSIKAFREKQMELYASLGNSKGSDSVKVEALKEYHNNLIKNAYIKRYLDAEKKFNDLVSDLFKTINNKIQNSLK